MRRLIDFAKFTTPFTKGVFLQPDNTVRTKKGGLMEESLQFDFNALAQLIPICLEYKSRKAQGENANLEDTIRRAAQAVGVEDVDAYVQGKIAQALNAGLGEAFDEQQASALAHALAGVYAPVGRALVEFARGKTDARALRSTLDEICRSNTDQMQRLLQNALGINDELADYIAARCGAYTVTLLCFAAALKICQAAARDARIAREQRIEIERMCNEAIAQLKAQRKEGDALLSAYMFDQLTPFANGIAAIDRAIIDNDDDGYIAANAELWKLFGRESQYRTADEFNDLMLSDEAFKL